MFNEIGHISHPGCLPEEIVHVPLIFLGAQIQLSTRHKLCESVDLFSTITSFAGLDFPKEVDGQNLFKSKFRPRNLNVAYSVKEIAYITSEQITRSPPKPKKKNSEIANEMKSLGSLN